MKGIGKKIYEAHRLFCDRFDNYAYSEEFGIIPFDEFIRKAEIVKVYYIGGIVDYHWRDGEKKNTINLKWTASQIFVMQSILLQIKI